MRMEDDRFPKVTLFDNPSRPIRKADRPEWDGKSSLENIQVK